MDKVLGLIQILVLKSDSEVNTTEVEEAQATNWANVHALRLGGRGKEVSCSG